MLREMEFVCHMSVFVRCLVLRDTVLTMRPFHISTVFLHNHKMRFYWPIRLYVEIKKIFCTSILCPMKTGFREASYTLPDYTSVILNDILQNKTPAYI